MDELCDRLASALKITDVKRLNDIKALLYADDVALIAHSRTELQKMVRYKLLMCWNQLVGAKLKYAFDVWRAPVQVFELSLLDLGPDWAELRTECSSGMYVRALTTDLAAALGRVCVIETLVRTHAAGLSLSDCFTWPNSMAAEGIAVSEEVKAVLNTPVLEQLSPYCLSFPDLAARLSSDFLFLLLTSPSSLSPSLRSGHSPSVQVRNALDSGKQVLLPFECISLLSQFSAKFNQQSVAGNGHSSAASFSEPATATGQTSIHEAVLTHLSGRAGSGAREHWALLFDTTDSLLGSARIFDINEQGLIVKRMKRSQSDFSFRK
eukprot:g80569.t1